MNIFKLILIPLISISIDIQSHVNNDSIIYWRKNIKLDWYDFQGNVPINKGKDIARSYLAIRTTYFIQGNLIDVKVLCSFNKRGSWIIDTSQSVLKHEQLHFDIAELYARKVRKGIPDLRNCNKATIEECEKLVSGLLKEYHIFDKQYDEETAHSVNIIKQAEWEKKIAKELECLKEYDVDYSEYIEE